MTSDIASVDNPVRERGDGREEKRMARTDLKWKAEVKVAQEDDCKGKSDKSVTSISKTCVYGQTKPQRNTLTSTKTKTTDEPDGILLPPSPHFPEDDHERASQSRHAGARGPET